MKWFKKKRIIVPFDYSDDSMRAVRVGMSLAEKKEDVHLVHVLNELPSGEVGIYWTPSTDEQRKALSKTTIKDKLTMANIGDIKIDVLIGDPADEIISVANEIETDLIVIPSHGYTGLKKMLMGSVAQKVVRHAKCAVLVLKD